MVAASGIRLIPLAFFVALFVCLETLACVCLGCPFRGMQDDLFCNRARRFPTEAVTYWRTEVMKLSVGRSACFESGQ